MKNRMYLIFSLLILIGGCKKDVPETHETDVYHFFVVNMGSYEGSCSPVLQAYLDSNRTEQFYFKPVYLPEGISNRGYYKGRFEILNEADACWDSRPDPHPDYLAPPIQVFWVNILEWEKE